MAAPLSLWMILAVLAAAQTLGISDRLQRALATSGHGEMAVEALKVGDFLQIEKLLDEAGAANPATRAEIIALQGDVAFLAADMPDAAARLTDAARLAPLSDSDTFTLAMALVRLGDDDRARGLLVPLSQSHPNHAIYVYWLGRLDYNQRRYDDAVTKLTRATELDPASSRIWDSLGLAYDMQGQNDRALTCFEKASDLNRTQGHPSPWPPHDLAFLLLRMDKPHEAESGFREALRYDPGFAQAHYHLARVLEKENRDAEAVKEYIAAISEDKSSPEPCYSLAMLYRKLGRKQDSDLMFANYKKRKEAEPAPDVTVDRQTAY